MSKHGSFQITQKVFLRKKDQILVLRDRKSGYGDLPGGRMNEDEFFGDWMESVKRELEEELGSTCKIKISPDPILVHKHRVTEGNFPCIIIGYEAEWLSGDLILSDEHDYMEWVHLKTFDPSLLFSEYMLEAFLLYQKKYA